MTQATHTPEPWITARTHAGEGYVHSVRQNIAGQPTVAMVWDDNDDPMIPNPNARLIAAAPELLEVLELIVNRATRSTLDSCGQPMVSIREALLDKASAAIAKAKGE